VPRNPFRGRFFAKNFLPESSPLRISPGRISRNFALPSRQAIPVHCLIDTVVERKREREVRVLELNFRARTMESYPGTRVEGDQQGGTIPRLCPSKREARKYKKDESITRSMSLSELSFHQVSHTDTVSSGCYGISIERESESQSSNEGHGILLSAFHFPHRAIAPEAPYPRSLITTKRSTRHFYRGVIDYTSR